MALEVHVIAPDSNRSATARSITTRSPLWVEEIPFEDGIERLRHRRDARSTACGSPSSASSASAPS